MNILTGGQPSSGSGIVSSVRSVLNLKPSPSSTPAGVNVDRLSSIFLLTDGMPNINPPRGHIPMLKMYLESYPPEKTQFTINTFGFGYSLDSPLLHEIAKVGGGCFGFIPDSGMVGTVFVHAVANTYATYAGGLYVDIEVDSEDVAKEMDVEGSFDVVRSSWGVQVPLGALQYGQTRDLVVKLPRTLEKAPLTVTARCSPWNAKGEIKATRVINAGFVPAATSAPDVNLVYNHFRLTFVSKVLELFKDEKPDTPSHSRYQSDQPALTAATPSFNQLIADIRAAFPNGKAGACQATVDTLDLVEDIEGQVLLGIKDSAAYNKWGRHYLLSLSRSHQRQQCGNFKDSGLQPYGRDSPLFKAARDEIDKTFDDLPPPTPSVTASPSYRSRMSGSPGRGGASFAASSAAPKKAIYSMSQYNSRAAPCFAGHSLIELANGSKMPVSSLRAGVTVKTPTGPAEIVAIVKTVVSGGELELCSIGDGLVITPWHPVNLDGWKFPADIVEPRVESCEAVYSILLEKTDAHAVFIGGVQCVTLGHGVVDKEDVRSHPFLSDYDAVVGQLAKSAVDGDGFRVAIGTVRDGETGLMTGFVWKEVIGVGEKTPVEVVDSPALVVVSA